MVKKKDAGEVLCEDFLTLLHHIYHCFSYITLKSEESEENSCTLVPQNFIFGFSYFYIEEIRMNFHCPSLPHLPNPNFSHKKKTGCSEFVLVALQSLHQRTALSLSSFDNRIMIQTHFKSKSICSSYKVLMQKSSSTKKETT